MMAESGAAQRIDIRGIFAASGVGEVLERLDAELVGLMPVKERIREIAALLIVERLRGEHGLQAPKLSLHMSFTGDPGTGKTTVAMRMAEILQKLGYIRNAKVVTVTRDDLVGQFIGHTAPKTKEALKRAVGGVLFIDEAYYLHRPENERDYGQEAVEILMQCMENQRDDLVVLLAGYRDRMRRFFASNPGLRSRIAHHIDFPNYSIEELVEIAHLMVRESNYCLSSEAQVALRRYLERRKAQPGFANGRSVRNAIERARLRQAQRLWRQGEIAPDDLAVIEPPDILASRVFSHNGGCSKNVP
jgi:probable Rubsico expression protein CbbX